MVPRNGMSLSLRVGIVIVAAVCPVRAGELLDFEAGYVTNTSLDNQYDWHYWWLTHSTSPTDFQPQTVDGNNLLQCRTDCLTEYWRAMPRETEVLDLTWRWKASAAGAKMNFGPSGELVSTNNNYEAYRARVMLDATTWKIKGAGWTIPTGEGSSWQPGRWYYMRLRADASAGTFSVWVDTAAERASEIQLAADVAMAGSGPLDRLLLKADQGAGSAEIDDIAWGASPPPPGGVELQCAFAFGATNFTRSVPGAPGRSYTKVVQNGANFYYDASTGHGYTNVAAIDGSPNNRGVLSGDDEIYDEFIGVKGGEGNEIVFRINVPNGAYRFVAAGGDAQYGDHGSKITVSDGSSGTPLVLVERRLLPANTFYTVGYAGAEPPKGDGQGTDPQLLPMVTPPVLAVTSGYLEVHQIADGAANGGDLCLLEVWRAPPPDPRLDADGDGFPDAVEFLAGSDPLATFPPPRVAIPDRWDIDEGQQTVVTYDYSAYENFSTRTAVQLTIPARAMPTGIVPVIRMAGPADPGISSFEPEGNSGIVSGTFLINGEVLPGATVTVGLPLPDGVDLASGAADLKVWHHHGEAWSEEPIVAVSDGVVHVSLSCFSNVNVVRTGVIYVDGGNGGAATHDGTGWPTAYADLQEALGVATAGDELWVAQGEYKPGVDRGASFLIPAGVSVYGGFRGAESSLSERSPNRYETTLTGDLSGDDATDAAGNPINRTDNAYHVVRGGAQTGGEWTLDGFTITGGYAESDNGGGCLVTGPATGIAMVNCRFEANHAARGGGLFLDGGDYPNPAGAGVLVSHCAFENNTALLSGGAIGGQCASLDAVSCTFARNHGRSGGALNGHHLLAEVQQCVFEGNGAADDGGAVATSGGDADFVNCLFVENSAEGTGGAVVSRSARDYYANCTFVGNGAREVGGAIHNDYAEMGVVNSILYGNTAATGSQISLTPTGTLVMSHTDTEGGLDLVEAPDRSAVIDAGGNKDEDPMFLDPRRYAGADGVLGTKDDGLVPMRPGSPCVDAGTATNAPSVDITGRPRPRPQNGGYDMGAYESAIKVIYVEKHAPTGGDGESWPTALGDIQPALEKAAEEIEGTDDDIMVWVAGAGPYVPTKPTKPADEYTVTFYIPNGVGLYGGFAGDELHLGQRKPWNVETELRPGITGELPYYSTVVVMNSGVLDGFVLDGGNGRAAALAARGGNPVVNQCVLRNFDLSGGGFEPLVDLSGSDALLRTCHIRGNTVTHDLILALGTGALRMERCVIAGNAAPFGATDGGLLRSHPMDDYTWLSTPKSRYLARRAELVNSVFCENEATPVLTILGCRVDVTNCTFYNNRRPGAGDAAIAWFLGSSQGTIVNTILTDVLSGEGTHLYLQGIGGPDGWPAGGLQVRSNCIAATTDDWKNDPPYVRAYDNKYVNENADLPGFSDAGNPAGADGWFGTLDDGLQLSMVSGCMNSGTVGAARDVLSVRRPQGPQADIGAYEYPRHQIVTVGRYNENREFETDVAPYVVDNIVDKYSIGYARIQRLGCVIQLRVPNNEYTRPKDVIYARIWCVDGNEANLSGTKLPATFHRVPGTDLFRTLIVTEREVRGKQVIVHNNPDPELANIEMSRTYVLLGESGCYVRVEVPTDQFE